VYELYSLIIWLLNLFELVIFIWVVMGWLQMFGALPYSRPLHIVMDVLYRLTEPFLGLIRRFLPSVGGLDLSPLVAIVLIEVVKILLRDIMF